MRKSYLAIALLAVLILSFPLQSVAALQVSISTVPFRDVSANSTYANDFALLKTLGVMEGYRDGRVGPGDALTRVQFAKIAVSLMDRDNLAPSLSTLQPNFSDGDRIALGWWGWVNTAEHLGLIRGYADGSFRPHSVVSFVESVVVLLRVAGYAPHLQGLAYPQGYLDLAAEVGITRTLNLMPHIPITRSEVARLAANTMRVKPPRSDGTPDPSRSTLLQLRPHYVEGVVEAVSEDRIQFTDGASSPMADPIHVFGASTLNALVNTRIIALQNASGQLQYMEVAPGSYTASGRLGAHRTSESTIRVENRTLIYNGNTQWSVNGRSLTPTSGQIDQWVARGDAETTVRVLDDLLQDVRVFYWDVPELVVSGVPQPRDGGGWNVPVDVRRGTANRSLVLQLPESVTNHVSFTSNVPNPQEIRVGDVLRMATVGASGVGDVTTLMESLLHRLDWRRETQSGSVHGVEVTERNGELMLRFLFEDGSVAEVLETRLYGAPRDMSLNDLRHVNWVSFSLGYDGVPVRAVEAYVQGTPARYVKILTVGELGGDYYVVVEQNGEASTYQLAFPALWVQFADEELRIREGDYAQIRLNSSGKCEGVFSWVRSTPLIDTYMVASIESEQQLVTLRRLNPHRDMDEVYGQSLDLLATVQPVVLDASGEFAGIGALAPGRSVKIWLDDRGNVGILMVQ